MRVELRLLRFQQLVLDDGRGLGDQVRFAEGSDAGGGCPVGQVPDEERHVAGPERRSSGALTLNFGFRGAGHALLDVLARPFGA